MNSYLDMCSEEELIELTYRFTIKFPFSKNPPRTIIDNYGNRVKEDCVNIYLNKANENLIPLPKWSKSCFMKQSFEDSLKNKFATKSKRELANKLNRFNVSEYSYILILKSLIRKAGTDKEKVIDLIRWLYSIWESKGKLDLDLWSLSSRPKIKVIDRDGNVVDSANCYLGNAYVNTLDERLLKSNTIIFISEPKVYGLEDKNLSDLKRFFIEIGCKDFLSQFCYIIITFTQC